MNYLEQNNYLTDNQHAFRKNRSCESQLINVIHDWTKMLDEKKQVDVFILDFEKAFDTVPHELVKTKLHSLGVSKQVIIWIGQFLANRQQKVVINGTSSKSSDVVSGVPQGTVLGPILFLVHINDIGNKIKSKIRLFADDCVCYREINSFQDTQTLQNDIDALGSWAREWGMRFQPVKCNTMTVSNKKKNIRYNYTLEGTELESLDHIKYLGVTITQNLNWNKHITLMCNKTQKILGLVKRNLKTCPTEVKMQAYKGLIRPILEYSSSVWDPHQQYLIKKIEAIQRRAARFISNNYEYEPGSMTKILDQLNLIPLQERRRQNRLIALFKGLHGGGRIPLHELQTPVRKTKNMNIEPYRQVYARTNQFKYSFVPRAIRDWNSLDNTTIQESLNASNATKKFTELIRKGGQKL